MNSQFDKSAFSILLKRALGNRTQKSFAEDIQISKEHLSRLVTQKRETPPTIDTLTKIALNSQNRVSLQELLSVCGYDPNTISVPTAINHMMEAVKLALSHIPYEFSEHLCDNTSFYQMTSCFANGPIHQWYFHFLSDNTFGTVDHELSSNLLSLISKELKSDDKISFVTSIPLLFQYYMEHRPHNLNLNLSFILINEHTLTVSKEIVLQTASSIPYEVLNNYTFPSNPE